MTFSVASCAALSLPSTENPVIVATLRPQPADLNRIAVNGLCSFAILADKREYLLIPFAPPHHQTLL